MYERFTDRARRVMQLANQEAQRFGHEYIGTEHVLLALTLEGSGVAANVLKNLNVDLRKVRREVEKIVQHGPGGEQVVRGDLPQTPRTKKVIEYSIEEARRLNHNYVGTEHLLLGMMREQEGVAAQILMNLGVDLDDAREEVLNMLGGSHGFQLRPPPVPALTDSGTPPALTPEQVRSIHEWAAQLDGQEGMLVIEQAAGCREKAEALRRLLAWYEWSRGRG